MIDLSSLKPGDRVWFHGLTARRNDCWLEVVDRDCYEVRFGLGFAIAEVGSNVVKDPGSGWKIGEIFASREDCAVAVEQAVEWRRLFGQVSDGLRSRSLEDLEAIDKFMRGLDDGRV